MHLKVSFAKMAAILSRGDESTKSALLLISAVIQVMVGCLFGTKPLPDAVMTIVSGHSVFQGDNGLNNVDLWVNWLLV